MRILVLACYVPPAYLAGGPVTTLDRIVREESRAHDLRVMAEGTDMGDTQPLAGIDVGTWSNYPDTLCSVYFSSGGISGRAKLMLQIVREMRAADLTYVNTLWSPIWGFFPCALAVVLRRRLLIATRGQLSPEALAIKSARKGLGLRFFRLLEKAVHPIWHFSSSSESVWFVRAMSVNPTRSIILANPAPEVRLDTNRPAPRPRSLVSVGRVVPIKRHLEVLHALAHVPEPLSLDIIGPIEDSEYYSLCLSVIAKLPQHTIRFLGPLEPTEVAFRLPGYEAFISGTSSENFGQAIAEAIAAGIPVILPDTTIWSDFARFYDALIDDFTGPGIAATIEAALGASCSLESRELILAKYKAITSQLHRSSSLFSEAAKA